MEGGKDFESLEAMDLSKVNSFSDMATAMSKTAFTGRQLGEAVDVSCEMFSDKESFNVLTLSGAMTMAQMSYLICDMIDNEYVDAVVSTGALMCHGFVEAAGMKHFKAPVNFDDEKLREKRLNRVYDTIEPEENLDFVSEICNKVFDRIDKRFPTTSSEICVALGRYLVDHDSKRGIFKSAFEKKVPIFIPAFTDSELALDYAVYNNQQRYQMKPELKFDPFKDFNRFVDLILHAKKRGIFTIGGGVPRNWAQQAACYWDLYSGRFLQKNMKLSEEEKRKYETPYNYAVRICPEPVHYGGLSGCSYSESVSWGKILPKSKGGKYAEVLSDATVAWPIILKAIMERLEK
tara:strand:+ start:65007 stop:66050 length:1044 start_codon:yes stop_codon:yes gene_type:complete